MVKTESPTSTVPLRNIYLHVTKACNLHCQYCYFSARKPLPNEMSTKELVRFWPQVVAVSPQKLILTGGEPLLRDDVLELLETFRDADSEHKVLRCINTNGHLATPSLAKRLVGLADEVRVSLDALEERNDALRGPGNFAAACKALETFYEQGFEPKVLVTLTSRTLPDLEELICRLVSRGFTRINYNAFRPIGRGHAREDWRADPMEVRAAMARAWNRLHPDRQLPCQNVPPVERLHCGVGSFLNIMPNGDVFPCHVLTDREFRCGNVRHDRLTDLCQKKSFLGRLAELDFSEMVKQDSQLQLLSRPGTCMGTVHQQTRDSKVWTQIRESHE